MSSTQSNEHRPYFVPGFGISRHIIFSHINFFLGPYASCRSYSYHGREGYLITAPGPQLTKVCAPTFTFSFVERKSCSRIAADHNPRARLKICKRSHTSTSRQQPKGCGGRVDLAPTITTSTNQSICPKDASRVIIEAGEFRRLAPHPSPPFLLLMLLRLHQSTGRTSFCERGGVVEEIRSPLPCFVLQRLPALTNGMGGRSGDHYWSRFSPLRMAMGQSYIVFLSHNLILFLEVAKSHTFVSNLCFKEDENPAVRVT